MGLRLGLTSDVPADGFFIACELDEGSRERRVGALAFPLAFDIDEFCGGARLLLVPSCPSFMILAGVTGVKFGVGVEDIDDDISMFVVDKLLEFDGTGGAGGGMDKSTGEGVSSGISGYMLFLRPSVRVERIKGVEQADFEPLDCRLG